MTEMDWRKKQEILRGVPLGTRCSVLEQLLRARLNKAAAALKAIAASRDLTTAGCDSAGDAFDAARWAIREYALDEAFEAAIVDAWDSALSEGEPWATELERKLREFDPPPAPVVVAPDVTLAQVEAAPLSPEEMPF